MALRMPSRFKRATRRRAAATIHRSGCPSFKKHQSRATHSAFQTMSVGQNYEKHVGGGFLVQVFADNAVGLQPLR
eukprot:1603550-Lingulodinium_polyedra.AAC.1